MGSFLLPCSLPSGLFESASVSTNADADAGGDEGVGASALTALKTFAAEAFVAFTDRRDLS